MTRDEAMRQIAELHTAWSLRYGDRVPYVHADVGASPTDLAIWQADRSATAEQQDELNVKIVEILGQIEDSPSVRSTYGSVIVHPDARVRELAEAALHLPPLPHMRYSDDQERDESGRFAGSGGGGGGSSSSPARTPGGRPGEGSDPPPRQAYADAVNHDELHAAAQAEFHRITGRAIRVDMEGSDLNTAKAHLEGVTRGLEAFPEAGLVSVQTYGHGSTQSPGKIATTQPFHDAFAITNTYGTVENNKFVLKSNIYFNNDPGVDVSASSGFLAVPTHTGIAYHEMGHVVSKTAPTSMIDHAYANAVSKAGKEAPRRYIGRKVSKYAASNPSEFAAEAFADVMANGSRASDVSRAAFDEIKSGYGP